MDDLTPEAVLRRRGEPELAWVEVEGELVVYDSERDALHLLDPAGTAVWKLLDGSRSIRGTSKHLAGAFGNPVEDVLADVLGFARRLQDLGLAVRLS
ncbi:MAG: PqqD family peptide modification chaperone [Propionibacteriales bacterium]|nr:PqqD family peptide modification chaperone [Propionibacteriales bacterium]